MYMPDTYIGSVVNQQKNINIPHDSIRFVCTIKGTYRRYLLSLMSNYDKRDFIAHSGLCFM